MAMWKTEERRFEALAVSAVVALGALGVLVLWAPGVTSASGTGCTAVVTGENPGHNAIQLAINAHPGGVICVTAGTYPEQVTISSSNTVLKGAGPTKTILEPSAPLTLNTYDYDTSGGPTAVPAAAIVLVEGASGDPTTGVTGVLVEDLQVNGVAGSTTPAFNGCGVGYFGVDFQASSGTLVAADVLNVAMTAANFGCQTGTGLAVYAYNGHFNFAGTNHVPDAVVVSHTLVTGFQKNGITCDDPQESCTLTADTVTGIGPTSLTAQNGIQIGFGAYGAITLNHVSQAGTYTGAAGCPVGDQDNYANCSGNEGAGILLYDSASGSLVQSNVVSRTESGIYYYDDGTMDGGSASTTISHNAVYSSNAYGIVADGAPGGGDSVTITFNAVSNRPVLDPTVWGAPGILVDTGTFHISGNSVSGSKAVLGASNGVSQAVCGPSTPGAWWSPYYSCATNQSTPTAAIEGASENASNPTTMIIFGNVYTLDSYRLSTLGVLGGTVNVLT